MVARWDDGRRRRSRLRLALLVFTAVVLITIDARSEGGPLTAARNVFLDILGPVRSVASWAFGPVGNAWQGITDYDDLEAENAELRAQLAEVESSILQVGELERDRQSLLALLDARDTVANIPRLTAQVIDAPISNFERTIELDKGSREGVAIGMPVETGAGLIGRVIQVSSTRSRVELLTDPNFDVSVRLVRSGDDGSAAGRGPGADLELSFIELETVVIPGETVVTSGFGGSTFPPGLLVGTVVDVVANAVQGTNRVTVHPAAELNRLRWVSVILFEPEEPAPVVVERTPDPVPETTIADDAVPNDGTGDGGTGEPSPSSTVPVTEPESDVPVTEPETDVPVTSSTPDTETQGVGGAAVAGSVAAIMFGVHRRQRRTEPAA